MSDSEATTRGGSSQPVPWSLTTDESTRELDTPDAFGHVRYVHGLMELLKTSLKGHTVGLFGGYGTGKSWIVRRLGKALTDGDLDIGMVEYNAWRYAEGELRRDFLIHLQLELKRKKLLKDHTQEISVDEFKVDIDTTTEGPAEFSWPAVGKALKDSVKFGLLLIGLSALLGLPVGLVVEGFPKGLVFMLTGAFGGLAWAGNSIQALLNVNRFTVRNIQVTHRPRVEFPEEFLAMFEDIVAARIPERLVIVIDNIDRCSPDVAMAVLSTIKNFLEPSDSEIFFLIPCDIYALERHLAAAFQSRGMDERQANSDAREYLGKFFGSSISITGFDEPELKRMAEDDLKSISFGFELPDEEIDGVSAIAASANRESPRELKIFINRVASSALLMRHSSPDPLTSLTSIDLAKLNAIQDKAPNLWSVIRDDPLALEEAESRINRSDQDARQEGAGNAANDEIRKAINIEEERRIIRAVQWHRISHTKIRLFLGLRMPPEAEKIPRYFEYLTVNKDFQLPDEEIDGVSAIAASANRESPRELKIFINRVASSALLMRHSSPDPLTSLTSIDLAKLNAIQDKAPNLWSVIRDDPLALEEAESRINRSDQDARQEGAGNAANDEIRKAINIEEERRIIRAVQWHRISHTKIRLFLGLRMPPEAEKIPRYFEYLTALEDADLDTAQNIAETTESNNRPQLLDIAGGQVKAVTQRLPERAVNPALVGISMLSSFDFPVRQRREFLTLLPLSQIENLVWRVGPITAATAIQATPEVLQFSAICNELIRRFGESEYDPQEIAKAITIVAPQFLEQETTNIEAQLSEDLSFEHWLRDWPIEIRRKFVTEKSLNILADSYKLPEEPNETPETHEVLEILANQAELFTTQHVLRLSQQAEAYLLRRSESGVSFEDVDVQVIKDILDVARLSDVTPIDAFGEVLTGRLEAKDQQTYQLLGQEAPEIEPLLTGQGRAAMVLMILRLIEGASGLPETEEFEIAERSIQLYSDGSRREILEGASTMLQSRDKSTLLRFTADLSRSLDNLRSLNRVAVHRSTLSPASFYWIRTEFDQHLPISDLRSSLRGTLDGMIHFLQSPDTFLEAADELLSLKNLWLKGRSQEIISSSIPYLDSDDPSMSGKSSLLISEAIDRHQPRNSSQAYDAAATSLVNGPLSWDGPDELFALQLVGLDRARQATQVNVRNLVRTKLQEGGTVQRRVFAVGSKLIEANIQHSDLLLRPTVDYALTATGEVERGQVMDLLNALEPSEDELERNRESLIELAEHLSLPERLLKFSVKDPT